MLQTHRVRTVDQVRSFLDGAEPVEVQPLDRGARYEFVARTLRRFRYGQPGKADKGVVRRFLVKVSGLSRAQLTRLIAQHRSTGRINDRRGPPRRPFPRRYTTQDIRLLAQVDALHGTVSGPATRKLCERAYRAAAAGRLAGWPLRSRSAAALLKPGTLRHTSPVNAARDEMYARFWGVRGSIPVSDPRCARYGGNTSCVEVRCGGAVLVFDAGTGIRPLGSALLREGCEDLDLFLTHGHIDHVFGLPFFAFAYRPGNALRVWSGFQAPEAGTTESAVRSLMSAPLLPITPGIFPAEVSFRDFSPGDELAPGGGISLRTAPLRHPGGATGYRVDYRGRSICYVTDTEHDPETPDANILALADGADVLIYDAMFTDEELPRHRGWGHSTWEEGARLCRAAGVGTYAIFHHAPERDDEALDRIGAAAGRMFPGAVVAREGMVLTP